MFLMFYNFRMTTLVIFSLKGDSVKKAVQAFEALSDSHETETGHKSMAPPAVPPGLKAAVPGKALTMTSLSSASSLDEAVNAPTRVTRTKTRAMAKAAAANEEDKRQKVRS